MIGRIESRFQDPKSKGERPAVGKKDGNQLLLKHGHVRKDGKVVVKLRPTNPNYRALLSIDGGGVRGIVPAKVLEGFENVVKEVVRELHPKELEEVSDEDMVVDVKDYFDMVAGNSAGSILALYVASGGGTRRLYEQGGLLEGMEPGSASAGIALVDDFVRQVFKPRWYAGIPGVESLSGLFWSKYGGTGLSQALENTFGDLRMSGLLCNTYVPAYELENARPVGFYTTEVHDSSTATTVAGYLFPHDNQPKTQNKSIRYDANGVPKSDHFGAVRIDIPVRVVAQASSSAPVFFSPAEYSEAGLASLLGLEHDKVSWADGGLVSNNPTMQALGLMASLYSDKQARQVLKSGRMAVLSLGTGTRRENFHIGGGQGLAPWNTKLITALMDAHSWMNHQIVDALFDGGILGRSDKTSDRYVRIDKVVAKGSPDFEVIGSLDSYDKIDRLKAIGEELVDENRSQIKEFIKEILMSQENNS